MGHAEARHLFSLRGAEVGAVPEQPSPGPHHRKRLTLDRDRGDAQLIGVCGQFGMKLGELAVSEQHEGRC